MRPYDTIIHRYTIHKNCKPIQALLFYWKTWQFERYIDRFGWIPKQPTATVSHHYGASYPWTAASTSGALPDTTCINCVFFILNLFYGNKTNFGRRLVFLKAICFIFVVSKRKIMWKTQTFQIKTVLTI